jgi:hypothetical protein
VALALAVTMISVGAATPALAQQAADNDREAIREVVLGAYVSGIHGNGDRGVIRAGFHPGFVMKVLRADGTMTDVTIEDWIARLPEEGTAPANPVRGEVPTVMLSGNAAVAEVAIYRDGAQIFTDYISLYRFPEGWRMVAKVYYAHPGG